MLTEMNLWRGIVLLLLAAAVAGGQTFDAASVKIADRKIVPPTPGNKTMTLGGMKGGPGSTDPGRITYTQVGLMQLLMKAWEVEGYQIVGPEWLRGGLKDKEFYNITATMPADTTRAQFQTMMQNLLVERFHIRMHHETRNYPGYELVVAPGGPKLKPAADPDTEGGWISGGVDRDHFPILPPGHGRSVVMDGSSGGNYIKLQSCTIGELIVPYLGSFLRMTTGAEINHIVDKTGLTGKYDYSLKFDGRPEAVLVGRGVATPQAGNGDPSGLPDLFKAMEQQLGLKLVKVKAIPLDTIVIDRMEKTPTEN